MILAHFRSRRHLALLAADLLEGRERDEVSAHVEACARCRREHAELRAVVRTLAADPVRAAEPDVPVAALVDRVERRLDGAEMPAPARGPGWGFALPVAGAAVLALALLGPELVSRLRPPPEARPAPPPAPLAVSEETLDRLERNLAREHAARYLSEAGDVLVAVAATGADCERGVDRLDVGEAPDRSRELLARRTLLVEEEAEAVASARAVLDDVELALREVAELPSCVRRRDVERLRRDVERRQLLMRIRLMTRELEG